MPKKDELNVQKILTDFRNIENSRAHRKATFKIEGDFEDAVRKIAKAKPKPKGH